MKPDETLKPLYEFIDELLRKSNRGCLLDSQCHYCRRLNLGGVNCHSNM